MDRHIYVDHDDLDSSLSSSGPARFTVCVAGFHTRLPLFPQRQTGDSTAADNSRISAGTFGVGLQSHRLRAALIWPTSAALSGRCRGALSPEFPAITDRDGLSSEDEMFDVRYAPVFFPFLTSHVKNIACCDLSRSSCDVKTQGEGRNGPVVLHSA